MRLIKKANTDTLDEAIISHLESEWFELSSTSDNEPMFVTGNWTLFIQPGNQYIKLAYTSDNTDGKVLKVDFISTLELV